MIVTIDGPAGSGKSTIARMVAIQLGWMYIDTGAMYRAVAWRADKLEIDPQQHARLEEIARTIDLQFEWHGDDLHVLSDGCDIDAQLRSERIAELASSIATVSGVRDALVEKQQSLAKTFPDVITEGRDQGSVAFPNADLKIFLDATAEQRAARRSRQLSHCGRPVDYEQTLTSIRARDKQDVSRSTAPLIVPVAAVPIDTTDLTIDQVVDRVLELIQQVRSR